MRILLQKDKRLNSIYESIITEEHLKVLQEDLSEIITTIAKDDILVVYCNNDSDIKKIKKFKHANILVATTNTNVIFLYQLIHIIHPLDVICLNNSSLSIKIRIMSNLDMIKGGSYEKNNMCNNNDCYC